MVCIEEILSADPSETDDNIRVFQRKLYIRAKEDKSFKAYSLYGKLCESETLVEAYRRVRSNYSEGVGVDEMSFEDIEQKGLASFLENIQEDLLNQNYQRQAVRQVLIPKEERGKFRKLGVPTIRDRVIQMGVKLLIEPLWEADFENTSYGFRPKRSSKDAIKAVKQNIYDGHQFVYDADLSNYFDSIPHNKLFILLKKRLVDRSILNLLGQWLTAPLELPNGQLIARDKGSPQGGVISPLLSNIYLHAFDKIVNNPKGKFAKANIRIVRYADDFLLMGTWYFSREILSYIDRIMLNMGLALNRSKTKLLHTSKSSLFYLGFEFRRIQSKFGWNTKKYTNIRPSMKSRSKLYTKLRDLLSKRRHWSIEWIVRKINQLLIGWLNYFSLSKVTHIWETIKVIKVHLDYKLFKWMKSKGRKAHRKLRQRPYEHLVKSYNLLDIEKYARLKTLAKAQ